MNQRHLPKKCDYYLNILVLVSNKITILLHSTLIMRSMHHSMSRCIFYDFMTTGCSEPIGVIFIKSWCHLNEQIFNLFLKEGGYISLVCMDAIHNNEKYQRA